MESSRDLFLIKWHFFDHESDLCVCSRSFSKKKCRKKTNYRHYQSLHHLWLLFARTTWGVCLLCGILVLPGNHVADHLMSLCWLLVHVTFQPSRPSIHRAGQVPRGPCGHTFKANGSIWDGTLARRCCVIAADCSVVQRLIICMAPCTMSRVRCNHWKGTLV